MALYWLSKGEDMTKRNVRTFLTILALSIATLLMPPMHSGLAQKQDRPKPSAQETKAECPKPQEPYSVDFSQMKGRVINKNGSEQPFTCFRCSFDSSVGHTVDWESLINDGKGGFAPVKREMIERIDFTPVIVEDWGRWGTAHLFDGRKVEIRLYIKSCEWANGKAQKGSMATPTITAIVFDKKQ